MREQIQVIYENGVLRPLEDLSRQFQERQRLTVTIDDNSGSTDWLADADPSVSLESVRRALGRTPRTIAQIVHAERNER